MAIAVVLALVPLVEEFLVAEVRDSFIERTGPELLSGLFASPDLLDDEAALTHAAAGTDIQGNPTYTDEAQGLAHHRVISRQQHQDFGHLFQVLSFNGAPTKVVVTLKVPLADLPAGFDALPEAERGEWLVTWGRSHGLLNRADY